MRQFEIFINNRPGELARVAELVAANGINIVAIASERCEHPLIRIVTDDEQSTRAALKRANLKFQENELMVIDMPDRPGELAKIARRLATAGVNLESIHIVGKSRGKTSVALVPDRWKRAEEALR